VGENMKIREITGENGKCEREEKWKIKGKWRLKG
jgi:hypothetical protein